MLPTVTVTRESGIAVFHVSGFNQNTTQQLVEDLEAIKREMGPQLRGIVLDLRGDPGGLLDQAVSLADVFLAKGPIVATVGRNPASRQYFEASGDAIAPRIPIVVLVNGGSASASEIVAAALQDAGRAVVVGTASYGKGTVQTVLRLPNDGELTLTWAELVAPAGYSLNGHGVVPTVCTSDLGDDGQAIATALERAGGAAAGAPVTTVLRTSLDDTGWAELRHSCPPRAGDRSIDLAVAERLLADPVLYSQAVHMMGAAPSLAAKPVGAAPVATERALTGGRRIAIFRRALSLTLGIFVMAKTSTVLIKLVSSADTGFYYVTKKNPRTKTGKLELKKFDPVARKHVLFKEAKIK